MKKECKTYHKDGTLWAKGSMENDVPAGYWEWFIKDGTKMRSGTFKDGKQFGEWVTYDSKGKSYKSDSPMASPRPCQGT